MGSCCLHLLIKHSMSSSETICFAYSNEADYPNRSTTSQLPLPRTASRVSPQRPVLPLVLRSSSTSFASRDRKQFSHVHPF